MTCCFLLWEFPFRHRRLSQVDLTKSHKGLFVMILALTMQIKSVTLKGNHFRPFITYIILYPDTSSKEAWFDDYLVMMGYVDLLGMDPEGWVYLGFTWGL